MRTTGTDRVKFYSGYGMTNGWEINKIIERINDHSIDAEWDLEDVIEFQNILKYIQVKRFADYLEEQTNIICIDLIKKIKAETGKYLGINKSVIISKYNEIDYLETDDFLEIIDKYRIYKEIPSADFKMFVDNETVPLYMVLKHKKIVDHFDDIVKEKIMSDSYNAETILEKHLEGNDLYLPPSLTNSDMLKLIDDYIDIDAERVNLNILRKIIHFPTGTGLNITDKIKLHAIRKEKEESDKIFSNGTGIESSVLIRYEKGLDEDIKIDINGRKVSITVNRDWIEENRDYPTLWNNFIHIFAIVDSKSRLTNVSKKNEMSSLTSAFMPKGNHLYKTSFVFNSKEMVCDAKIYSYIEVLGEINIRIEDMIEWFFNDYLSSEFSVGNFIVKMPSEVSTYFEKCRTILPEIDRIFKQYNALIEDSEIDQELIQISSSSVKANEVKSFISHKYAYPNGEWYQIATFLLFSDQSSIFYIPNKDEKYKNFLELIMRDNMKKEDFQEYQIQTMNWLFENGIIFENEDGFIKVTDVKTIFILKELYYEDVLNYFHYAANLRDVIDMFEKKQIVSFESSLLANNEQDYLDFYLNKSKFTNGYDLRNRYLHGTNVNDEKQYKSDYYSIIKLIIMIILKINDDLCLADEYKVH